MTVTIWKFLSSLLLVVAFVFVFSVPISSVVVNCRCGSKPWSTKDTGNLLPTEQCCSYFVESGEGNFTSSNSLCVIENEFIYKRFHSCCISLLRSAYCYQQKLSGGSSNGLNAEGPVRDPWARYSKLFGDSYFG